MPRTYLVFGDIKEQARCGLADRDDWRGAIRIAAAFTSLGLNSALGAGRLDYEQAEAIEDTGNSPEVTLQSRRPFHAAAYRQGRRQGSEALAEGVRSPAHARAACGQGANA